MSGFSSSSHSYHSAAGGEVEDASSVCASTITVKDTAAARGAESSAVFHKADAVARAPDKTQPAVPAKPKPQDQAKDLPCDKVQHKAHNHKL